MLIHDATTATLYRQRAAINLQNNAGWARYFGATPWPALSSAGRHARYRRQLVYGKICAFYA